MNRPATPHLRAASRLVPEPGNHWPPAPSANRIPRLICTAAIVLAAAAPAFARTVVMDDTECRRMAVISPSAPRHSWAGAEGAAGFFHTAFAELRTTTIGQTTFLVQFPLDKVPPAMRVTSAELVFSSQLVAPDTGPRIHIRRVIGDWGPGVSHLYRRTLPQKVPWTTPGAGSLGDDRARRPTAVVRLKAAGEHTVNVTEDVEMWCSGAAENQGWMIYLEEAGAMVRLNMPPWGPNTWKLRITFEPR